MRSFGTTFVSLALSVGYAFAQVDVDSYVSTEGPLAQSGLLANIGPDGSKSSGAYAGVVVASPSTTDPDYIYTWVRDSSLVFKVLIDQLVAGDDSLRTLVDEFVSAEAALQQVTNPSGTVSTGGLGEPKFYVNETAFEGSWGRPQRDGPALRSTAIMEYATWLWNNGNTSYVTDTLWPVIELDLDYVANNWNQTTYDLWEEVSSSSFFTTAVQHRSLRAGSTFATLIGQTTNVSTYDTQANNLLCFLQSYWNSDDGYITANTGGGRTGKDANTLLASIHTFDIEAGCDDVTFQPCSDKALSNLKVYVDSFRGIYTINSGINSSAAVATGRYPEDVYYDGNPWYLTTLAVAEQLYDALSTWSSSGELNITSTSLSFFQQFDSSVTAGTYNSSSTTYNTLTSAIKGFADDSVGIVANYTPSSGELSEQFSKENGTQVSAVNLTWSYASAITAFAARAGSTSTWGAKGLVSPTSCSAGPQPAMVAVTFNVDATTVEGENIYIVGSVSELSDWDASNPISMTDDDYPTWTVTVNITASTSVEYKYIRIDNDEVTWESDPNMSITTPASGTYTTNDTWR